MSVNFVKVHQPNMPHRPILFFAESFCPYPIGWRGSPKNCNLQHMFQFPFSSRLTFKSDSHSTLTTHYRPLTGTVQFLALVT
jgi:hypothetical protein